MMAAGRRDMPWETVFNFCMASIFASAVLGLMWVWTIQSGGQWWTAYPLIGTTMMVVGFIVNGVRKWLKSNAR